MSHTEIKNDLPFEFGLLHLSDIKGIPVAVAVVKATFTIQSGKPSLAEKQLPIYPVGKSNGESGKSSYQYEPECSYFKPSTDVALIAEAIPPGGIATSVDVEFSVGPLDKRAVVFGDRWWERSLIGPHLVGPEPFESIPLVYERAFGGCDRTDPIPERHTHDPRNPVGRGFQRRFAPGEDRIALPNIEDPKDLITSVSSQPKPVGFGFINPEWQPRAALAGTYDSAWQQTRMPLLPADFDLHFFNAASEGLVANGYLNGNEPVTLINCSRRPALTFSLPGVLPPVCTFRIAGGSDRLLPGLLDTIVVNSIENLLLLTWRCHIALPRGPEQLLEVHVSQGSC